MFAIMRELEAEHRGPFIPKPVWMEETSYDALMEELTEMDIRSLCLQLKLPRPDIYEPPVDYANCKPERINYPPALAFFFRNKDGVRQMKAKYKRRFGLPAGAE